MSFERHMTVARSVMKRRRNALRDLAKRQAIEIERLEIENDNLRSKLSIARWTALMCINGDKDNSE